MPRQDTGLDTQLGTAGSLWYLALQADMLAHMCFDMLPYMFADRLPYMSSDL